MEQLPKIVRQRLQATARAEPHPDASLLTAFAEKSLSGRERGQVLDHLAQCADCREVVSLALPGPVTPQGVAPRRAGFRRLSWPLLRWAAVGACVVIVGTAVTLRYGARKSPATFSVAKQAEPAVSEYKVAPQPPPSVNAGDKLALKVEPKMPLEDQRDLGTRERAKALARRSLSNSVTASPAPGMTAATNARAGKVAPAANQPPGAGMEQLVVTGAAPALSTAKTTHAELQKEARADENKFEPQHTIPQASESVEVQVEAPVINMETAELAPGKAKDAKAALKKAAPAGVAGGVVASRPMAPGQLALQGRQYDMLEVQPAARWSLSAEGVLLRSLDAGRSWQTVTAAEHVVFRAVSATGQDVWAGGSGGALFHSSDGGRHWVQVKPSLDGSALTDDIIGVEFSDASHGRVTTAKREVWTTSDAGQSWQKQ